MSDNNRKSNSMFSGILGTTTTNNSSSQVQPPSDPISNDDSTEGLDGLALDVVNIKNLFRAKLAEISGVINNDAENINKYVEQIKGIIGKNNSAKEKIQELKELMEKFSEVESYKNSRVKMDEAMKVPERKASGGLSGVDQYILNRYR